MGYFIGQTMCKLQTIMQYREIGQVGNKFIGKFEWHFCSLMVAGLE
jgi:hypothetical protein